MVCHIVPVQVGEFAQCKWCGKFTIHNDVNTVCLSCGINLSRQLMPFDSNLWQEEVNTAPTHYYFERSEESSIQSTLWIRGEDMLHKSVKDVSAHDDGEAPECNSARTQIWNRNNVVCESDNDIIRTTKNSGSKPTKRFMYQQISDLWQFEREAIQIEEEIWIMLVHAENLSNCWLKDGDSHCKFGLGEITYLSRFFTWDAPMGLLDVKT